jgi:D-beta-D-heptose 7-phosphate kinase/D-beta-D-heptose 1-phosphate adenosyltransferase
MDPILSALPNRKVLVIGDIMLDRYYWGKVRRISPEAPVPVVKMRRITETLGGAGNVANNLAGLGCRIKVIGVCGQDPTAEGLRRLFEQKGIEDGLVTDPKRPTTTKTRIMAHKQQVLRLDEEDVQPLQADFGRSLLDAIQQEIAGSHAVVISDYGKGMFADPTWTQQIIQAACNRRIPVLVDPKGTAWEGYAHATCVTPNTAELEAVAGVALENDEALLTETACGIRERLDLEWLLVTRGARGMCLVGPRRQVIQIAAQTREVYDVSGAGDTVIATLAAALAARASMPDASRIANLAAGIVVGKLGTQPILSSELSAALTYAEHLPHFSYAAAKMRDLDATLATVQQWKTASEKIVFTNGCFDLLHPGHISLLHQARALGDRLVVGLNTDDSVRRLKGPQRPILAEHDRAAMLSALECVDLVVHFDEDTPIALIEAIQPDILVKGSDYTTDQVVGKDIVEAYGGKVELVQLVQGYSTTQLTERVRSGNRKSQKQ